MKIILENVATLNVYTYICKLLTIKLVIVIIIKQKMKIEDEIKQRKPFINPQTKVVVNLMFTSSWMEGIQTQYLKPFDISIQQYNLLRILKGMLPEPATVKILIERMLDKNSNASRLVDKLKAKGLVERAACEEDRRRVDVSITEKGLQVLNEVNKTMELTKDIVQLTDEEAMQLSDLLDKLRG